MGITMAGHHGIGLAIIILIICMAGILLGMAPSDGMAITAITDGEDGGIHIAITIPIMAEGWLTTMTIRIGDMLTTPLQAEA